MKTKFILHSGMMKYDNEHNAPFFSECTKDLKDGDKVLWIGFARRDAAVREKTFVRDTELILSHTDKDLTVLNADESKLHEQVKQAQLVFVTGGDTQKLQTAIEKHPNFFNALKGKVYAGSSAGACICAEYYYGNGRSKIIPGLGILPIRLMVHSDNPEFGGTEENLKQLEEANLELELLALPQTQWVVREL